MPGAAFCFLCDQSVATLPDGRLREHSPPDPRGENVIAILRCAGSELSPGTTLTIAAHQALRGRRERGD